MSPILAPNPAKQPASPPTSSYLVTTKSSPVHTSHAKITTATTVHAQKHQPAINSTNSQGYKTVTRTSTQVTHRLPPRMGGPSSVPTASPNIKTEVSSWGSLVSPSPNVSVKKPATSSSVQTTSDSKPVTTTRPPVARQLLLPSTVSSKLLPKPIGSNRPVKLISARDITQTTQSTKTSPSISANHVSAAHGSPAHVSTALAMSQPNSLLNSFFSQVAAQVRSPMIWNEPPEMINEVSSAEAVVTTSISQNSVTVTIKTESYKVTHSSVISQSMISSASLAKGGSPTPSMSPTSSNSASPSPGSVCEEKPHLNPIGTERAHKRSSSQTVPTVPRLTAFQSGNNNIFIFYHQLDNWWVVRNL